MIKGVNEIILNSSEGKFSQGTVQPRTVSYAASAKSNPVMEDVSREISKWIKLPTWTGLISAKYL